MTAKVEVTPGVGAVMRFGEVVMWVGPASSAALVSYLSRGATALSVAPDAAHQLCDNVASVLRAGDPEPSAPFIITGPGPDGWLALLHGPVQCWDGHRWSAPTPAMGWMPLLLGHPDVVVAGAAGSPGPAINPESPYNLDRGVVPGGGFTLIPGAVAAPQPAAPEPAPEPMVAAASVAAPAPEPTAVPEPAPAAEPETPPGGSPPARAVDLRQPGQPARQALAPVGGPAPGEPAGPVVSGIRCRRGHFNHPRAGACGVCGMIIEDSERTPVSGNRPPMGVLIREDGAVFGVVQGYVLGTDPSSDPTVTGGLALPLTLPPGGGVQPVHAELRVSGWEVTLIDRQAPGGTFVLAPGEQEWTRLAPYQGQVLAAGTHLACGTRVLTYTSPWPA